MSSDAQDNGLLPARIIPPGRILRVELRARRVTWRQLAREMRRPPADIRKMLRGQRGITADDARGLAAAFGTSAGFWTNLEAQYQDHLALFTKEES